MEGKKSEMHSDLCYSRGFIHGTGNILLHVHLFTFGSGLLSLCFINCTIFFFYAYSLQQQNFNNKLKDY